jgi:transcriptional regulator GlxA family with amidase domain
MPDPQIETHASHGGQAAISIQACVTLLGVEGLPPPSVLRSIHTGGLAPWQVKRVRAYIEAHLPERMPLEVLAQQVRLSASTFSRSFRQSLGHPPSKYVMIRRVERAQTLMTATRLGLCDIAITCGFSDQAHFSRAFGRMTGTTPARWRKTMLDRAGAKSQRRRP